MRSSSNIKRLTLAARIGLPGLFLLLSCWACSPGNSVEEEVIEPNTVPDTPFSIDELQYRTFRYFYDLAHKDNFQIPDRHPTRTFSSIAATGFGLAAYLVGVERGYISRQEAAVRVVKTLEALWNLPQGPEESGISGYKGFFYHFLTLDQALRYKQVELSTIDTALLMAGILTVQSYFDREETTETRIRELADQLYHRVEWDWVLRENQKLSMGWHPEKGFIPHNWDGYNEAMILLVLALGSPTHPVPEECWDAWCDTYQWLNYQGEAHVNFGPLFGHQYSQMFIDFRGIQDSYMSTKGIDYFENSVRATRANHKYCVLNVHKFEGYHNRSWGLTACDGPGHAEQEVNGKKQRFMGYSARGASGVRIRDDGTIAPTAAGGSIPFEPDLCLSTLEYLWNNHYDNLVGTYGFKDAFNLTFKDPETGEKGWYDKDYLGIDQGPILIQAENHRTELIWKTLRKNPYIQEGLKRAGFKEGWLEEKKTK